MSNRYTPARATPKAILQFSLRMGLVLGLGASMAAAANTAYANLPAITTPTPRPTLTKAATKAAATPKPTGKPKATATKVVLIPIGPLPTKTPARLPTKAPTKVPTKAPAATPTQVLEEDTTLVPIQAPTLEPTLEVMDAPTEVPAEADVEAATDVPAEIATDVPAQAPAETPTVIPNDVPTLEPTQVTQPTPTTPAATPIAYVPAKLEPAATQVPVTLVPTKPGPTPTPTPLQITINTGAQQMLSVFGTACVDTNSDGKCSPDEARIPNVVVRNVNGLTSLTDTAGQYTLDAPTNSELMVTFPPGYTVPGAEHMSNMRVPVAGRVDLAVIPDTAANAAGFLGIGGFVTSMAAADSGSGSPVALFVALAILIVLLLLLLAVAVVVWTILRRTFYKQELAFREERSVETAQLLEDPDGWQVVAGQLIANAVRHAVSIDADAGILDATYEPDPRFTVVLRDGRSVVFTTAPQNLLKLMQTRHGERVINVSRLSPIAHLQLSQLWLYVLALRGMPLVTTAASDRWYIIVRGIGARAAATRATYLNGARLVPLQPVHVPAPQTTTPVTAHATAHSTSSSPTPQSATLRTAAAVTQSPASKLAPTNSAPANRATSGGGA